MADDQLQQELLKRTVDVNDRIRSSLATAANQFLVSTAAGAWAVKTIAQIQALLGFGNLVPYTGATGDVDLGAHGIKAADADFGGVDGNVVTEPNTGFMVHYDDAGGYVDIFFTHGVPKATGAGNPSLVTYLGNQRGYSYAVNDAHDFDPQEYYHQCEVGADFIWHLHFLSRANDGTNRFLKFELEASYVAPNGVETQFPLGTLEVTIAAGTTANTQFVRDIMTSNVPGIGPAWMLSARIKRVTATGTAPSVDPIIKALHAHAKIDTPQGSREVMAK